MAYKYMWQIHIQELKEWRDLLEQEPSVPGDGISQVKARLDAILTDERCVGKFENVLTVHDIEVGKRYQIIVHERVNPEYHGAEIRITKKNDKHVFGYLMHNTYDHEKGFEVEVDPRNLIAVG